MGQGLESVPEGERLRLNDWTEPLGWVLAVASVLAGLFILRQVFVPHNYFRSPAGFVLGVGWLAFGLLVASGARAGVIVRKAGITLQTRLRQFDYDWSDIAQFRLKRSMIGRPALRIQLQDGRELRAVGFEARTSDEWSRAEAILAELNRRASAAAESSAEECR